MLKRRRRQRTTTGISLLEVGLCLLGLLGCGPEADSSGELGAPCLSFAECSNLYGAWTDSVDAALCLTGAPEGYCSRSCFTDDQCPELGRCWSWFDEADGTAFGVCVLECEQGEGGCREGYSCSQYPGGSWYGCVWETILEGST